MTDSVAARTSGGRLVLAVDGGNSKTDLALLETTGALRAIVRGPRSSPHLLGADGCTEVLQGLLNQAVARAQIGQRGKPLAAAAQILLAGVDRPEERTTLHAAIAPLRWAERLVVDNDTLALLRSGTDRGWGVAVVCGAGINGLGRAPDGREARFAALGPISGDWGGGADIGLAAVGAAARSAEQRGPRTMLETLVPSHFGLSDPLAVSHAFFDEQIPRARLGELAPIVLSISDEDAVAAAIVRRLVDEVARFAEAALRRLELTAADPDVVLGGRLLESISPHTVATITEAVHRVAPGARVLVTPSAPIVGAALLALDAVGADPAACARTRSELGAASAELRSIETHAIRSR